MNRKDLPLGVFLSCCSLPVSTCLAMQGRQIPNQDNEPLSFKADFERVARAIYSGNAASNNVHSYIFLCRNGADGSDPYLESLERNCCTCDTCNFCSGGLSIAFITTEGELSGIDGGSLEFILSGGTSGRANSTKIIWSALSSFALDSLDRSCCGGGCIVPSKPKYGFKFVHGEGYLNEVDGNFVSPAYGQWFKQDSFYIGTDQGLYLRNSEYFLRMEADKGRTESIYHAGDFFTSSLDDRRARPPLRVVRSLRTALYRWEIAPSTITDVLSVIGKIRANRLVPKYHKFCIAGYNCAKFSRDTLKAFGINCIPDGGFSWKGFAYGLALGGIGSIVATRNGKTRKVITAMGAGGGALLYKTYQDSLPQVTVKKILENHKRLSAGLNPLGNNRDSEQRERNQVNRLQRNNIGQNPTSTFCIVAHIPPQAQRRPVDEVNRTKKYDMFNYELGLKFEYKTAQEAVRKSVETTEECGKFLKSQFE